MSNQADALAAVNASIRRWSHLSELATFAIARHGFGDSDGGFGVTYPGDLDEYDHVVERLVIPSGHVEVYGSWGPPSGYSFFVSESLYLQILDGILVEAGLHTEAVRVRSLLADVAET